jgi:hypothetical protein
MKLSLKKSNYNHEESNYRWEKNNYNRPRINYRPGISYYHRKMTYGAAFYLHKFVSSCADKRNLALTNLN